MTDHIDSVALRMRTVLQFIGLGLGIYAALFAASEALVYETGHANPFYKIATADRQHYDWLILGASHAMPLDFADTEFTIEAATGQSIINLALQGAGPLCNRFVMEQFLQRHAAEGLIYVVDSFAFRAKVWNEDRFTDSSVLSRTPFDFSTASRLWAYVANEGVSLLAPLDYVSGFSKLNNRERFERDLWDGETQFDRRYRPSERAEDERIAYLYPHGSDDPAMLSRYLEVFGALIDRAIGAGMNVKIVKMPLPPRFHGKLPGEAEFDRALAALLDSRGLSVEDDSLLLDAAQYYFDSDHLGRDGVAAFLEQRLVPLMLRL